MVVKMKINEILLKNYVKFEEIKELKSMDLEIAKEFAKIVEKLGYKVLYIHNFENIYWYDYEKQKQIIYNIEKEKIKKKLQNCLIIELWNNWQLIVSNGD
jgi:DNA-binding XRE family transcriptional regulator